MCGIYGYIGNKSARNIVFNGLKKLEYRGYDSSGIVVLDNKKVSLIKSEGKLSNLEGSLGDISETSGIGMGHTRWATHGAPTTVNAHPHAVDDLAIIHNGIIENYLDLKKELMAEGVQFVSETDTEVLLRVLDRAIKKHKNTHDAILETLKLIKGAYAIGILWNGEPDQIYLVKNGSPLAIGVGEGENFFASDALSLSEHTTKAIFLEDGEFACMKQDSIEFYKNSGEKIKHNPITLGFTTGSIEKRGYRHFMLKEIHDQPAVIANSIQRFCDLKNQKINFSELGFDELDLQKINRIQMIACGTAFYSGLVAKYAFESLAKIPADVELASEFRYRDPYLDSNTLFIAVSQSGETADTLACTKYAKEKGCQILTVCNVEHSSIPRETKANLYMHAGPEIGVASTKAFTSMILSLYFVAVGLGRKKGLISDKDMDRAFVSIKSLPPLVDEAIETAPQVEEVALNYYENKDCIYLGRGPSYPIAMEGALKLKEISYIHAEGYPGGELKHGPIALVDKHMPIVAIAPRDKYYEKMISNIEEVKARKGRILGVGGIDDQNLKDLSDDYLECPEVQDETLQTILSVIPLQLFSYYVAVKRGTDVDQPRNLAKSVTVE